METEELASTILYDNHYMEMYRRDVSSLEDETDKNAVRQSG